MQLLFEINLNSLWKTGREKTSQPDCVGQARDTEKKRKEIGLSPIEAKSPRALQEYLRFRESGGLHRSPNTGPGRPDQDRPERSGQVGVDSRRPRRCM